MFTTTNNEYPTLKVTAAKATCVLGVLMYFTGQIFTVVKTRHKEHKQIHSLQQENSRICESRCSKMGVVWKFMMITERLKKVKQFAVANNSLYHG